MLRSQSHYNIIDVLHESAGVLLENPDLVSLLLRCDSQPSRVSIEEWERCSLFYFLQMDGFEYAYYQTVDQAIPDQIWEGVYRAIRQEIARKKGYGRFWEEKGDSFGEAFRTCIDALMALSPYVQTPRQQSRNGEADYCKLAEGS